MPGEVARTKHRHRAEANAVLAQVRARQGLAVGQGPVDARAVKVTTTQHRGEQAHLATGAPALAVDARSRQCRFAANQLDKIILQRIQLIGHRLQELRPTRGTQGPVRRVRGSGGLGGGIHLGGRGLIELLRQGLAGTGVDAFRVMLPWALRWPPM